MKAFFVVKKISDFTFAVGRVLTLVAIFAILFSMILQVIMRYFFSNPLTWPEGLSKLLFIWMSYIAAGLVIKTRGHIIIDLFVNHFPQTIRNILKYVFSCSMLITLILFSFYSMKIALNARAHIYELGMISEKVIWLSMPISGFFMIIQMVFIICEDVCQQYNHSAPAADLNAPELRARG